MTLVSTAAKTPFQGTSGVVTIPGTYTFEDAAGNGLAFFSDADVNLSTLHGPFLDLADNSNVTLQFAGGPGNKFTVQNSGATHSSSISDAGVVAAESVTSNPSAASIDALNAVAGAFRVDGNGYPHVALNAAPADAAVNANEATLWYKSTNGAASLQVKAKEAGGTVRNGIIPITRQTAQTSPGNPVGTASTVGVMMGLAGAITPNSSGVVLIMLSGDIFNVTAIADGGKVQLRTGTGGAPGNAAALTGTTAGGLVQYIAATTAEKAPFALQAIVSGLALGTAVWIDVGLAAITGGTATIENLSLTAVEL